MNRLNPLSGFGTRTAATVIAAEIRLVWFPFLCLTTEDRERLCGGPDPSFELTPSSEQRQRDLSAQIYAVRTFYCGAARFAAGSAFATGWPHSPTRTAILRVLWLPSPLGRITVR